MSGGDDRLRARAPLGGEIPSDHDNDDDDDEPIVASKVLKPPPLLKLQPNGVPTYLIDHDRWVLWRTEQRINRKTGEITATKPPISSHTGKKCDVTDQRSWTTFGRVAAALEKNTGAWDGAGFVLGLVEGGDLVIGADLDNCIDAEGLLPNWALEFLAVMGSYAEESPSGTGIKCLARIRAADIPASRKLLEIAEGDRDQARTRSFGDRAAGQQHAPGVQLFLANRYFTITGHHWANSPEDVTFLALGQIAQLAHLLGPKERQTHTTVRTALDDDESEPDEAALRDKLGAAFLRNLRLKERWEDGTQGLNDTSRSGRDMSVLAFLITEGFTKGEVRAALRLFGHGKLPEEEAGGTGDRYFDRMWAATKASPHVGPKPLQDDPKPEPPPRAEHDDFVLPVAYSENTLAHLFSQRHAHTLIFCHGWKKRLRWTGGLWCEDFSVSVYGAVRAICSEQGKHAIATERSGKKIAAAINKAGAVSGIERLARHDHRHERQTDDFDANPWILNNPGVTTTTKKEPK